jgi:hypothetical protein
MKVNSKYPTENTNINPYDVRAPCDKEKNGNLCYAQMGWVDTYLNQPSVKAELGVSPERKFATCNMDVNQAFMLSGDWSNSALLLPELVNDGVRLLVYAGNAGEVFCCFFFLGLYSAFYYLCPNDVLVTLMALLIQCPVFNMLRGMMARSLQIKNVFRCLGIASLEISPRGFLFAMSCRMDCAPCNHRLILIFPAFNLLQTGTHLTIFLDILDLMCNYMVGIILYICPINLVV